nr:MAG: capsid protein [Chemarfal virus 254]
MRYHGNYCGPNWSAGQVQPSVISNVAAIDEFDETCKLHDAHYASNDDLSLADDEFYASNIGQGMKRTVAAVLVKSQQILRDITRNNNTNNNNNKLNQLNINQTEMKNKLRGSTTKSQQQPTQRLRMANRSSNKSTQLSTVPASFGYTIKMQTPKVSRNGNRATVVGSDFASNVYKDTSGSYQPAASVLINPAFFKAAMLGSLARTYEKYRLVRGTIEYVPSVATSNSGQVVMTVVKSCKNPYIAMDDSSFLSRALSSGNAVATPVWHGATIDLLPHEEFSIIDYGMDGDLDDTICQEVQVYAFGAALQTCGILLFHYEFEFKDPLYTMHASLVPNPVGNGVLATWIDDGAVNATTDAIRLTTSAFANTTSNASIYRLVFVQGRSVLPTGPATWATAARIQGSVAITTTTTTAPIGNLTMTSGTVLYGFQSSGTGTNLVLYGSYETAMAGGQNGVVLYQTATTATGSWAFFTTLVRYAPTENIIAN